VKKKVEPEKVADTKLRFPPVVYVYLGYNGYSMSEQLCVSSNPEKALWGTGKNVGMYVLVQPGSVEAIFSPKPED